MIIARVIGAVVCTIKDRRLSGYKLAIVQQYSQEEGKLKGEPFVAVDIHGSGLGSLVCVTMGSPAQSVLSGGVHPGTESELIPIDAAIVAIIDEIDCAR